MAKLKVNKELWSNLPKKKLKYIVSNLDVKIVPDGDAPLPKPKDVVYGMTIREAAMLLAKEDKTELLARLKQDLNKERLLKKSLKKRPDELLYLADAFSKKSQKERRAKTEIHLTKDEALLAEKIEKKLINSIEHVNAKSMLYCVRAGDVSHSYTYKSQRFISSPLECVYKCIEVNYGYGDILECWWENCY